MELVTAVGLFHLNAHIPECFVHFSLHFILGIGQLDVEILETLWLAFNKISPSARAISTIHSRVCKQLIIKTSCNIAKEISTHTKGLTKTKPAYELANTLDAVLVSEWKQEEQWAL
jgi:hypothetical protein